jgi:Mrp family chromosome partitioning ATPase
MMNFLQQAEKDHDLVVIDAPPVLPVADAQVLASMVDAAILVVRAGVCPYELASTAVELLEPKIIGAVLNGVTRFRNDRYYYGYYGRTETPES